MGVNGRIVKDMDYESAALAIDQNPVSSVRRGIQPRRGMMGDAGCNPVTISRIDSSAGEFSLDVVCRIFNPLFHLTPPVV